MTEMRESAAGNEYIEGNSILVSSQDAGLVIDKLQRTLGVPVKNSEGARDPDNPAYTDARLGLTLLEFVPPGELGAAELRRATQSAPEMFVQGGGEFALDAVLGALRTAFRQANAGWAPTLGKNRTLAQTIEGGVIIRRDDFPPTPVPAPPTPVWATAVPGDSPVRVGLLDTPFVQAHGWLDNRIQPFPDDRQFRSEPNPNWRTGHSTFLAGLIANQAPQAQILVAESLTDKGTGSSWEFARRLADFAEYNANADPDDRVSILNVSSGAFTYDGQEPLAIATALAKLGPEVVVVAAAGNHGDDTRTRRGARPYRWARRPLFPAAVAPVIAVGSADGQGRRSAFSPKVPWIDVLVRGEKLVSTYLTGPVGGFEDRNDPDRVRYRGVPIGGTTCEFNGFAEWSGTSFATALVSGAIAARTRPGGSAWDGWRALRDLREPNGYVQLDGLLGG